MDTSSVAWREWGREAFEDAEGADRPILLNISAVWCHWCHLMDATTYSDPDLVALIQQSFIPVRVDADRLPHVQDRYTAGGWPTNAFLTPTGEVLWAATYVQPEQFREVAGQVLQAWTGNRAALQEEITRRRRAMDAARSRQPNVALVRREPADDVLTALRDGFDARNGGFGASPKFPYPDAIELLYGESERHRDAEAALMADRTLDGMLAGELWDAADGGFFRYALEPDWTSARHEKLLEVNAGLLRAYALGAQLRGRADWNAVAERIVDWVERRLARPDGLWSSSLLADDKYFTLASESRGASVTPDTVLYTNRNAEWITALADAGGRLGKSQWIERARAAFDRLRDAMQTGEHVVHFSAPDGTRGAEDLLIDSVALAQAAIALAQATGTGQYIEFATDCVREMERRLWTDTGGFRDHPQQEDDIGALRYSDRPFEVNSTAARVLLDLASITGERSYHALAERVLAVLSPTAGRYGVAGAAFAMAVDEFFERPLSFVVVGDEPAATQLRSQTLRVPAARRRVWTLPHGGEFGVHRFDAAEPAVFVCGARDASPPLTDPLRIAEVARTIR